MKETDQSHRFGYLVLGLILVAYLNKIFLWLLGQHSQWGAEYSLAGLILLLIYATFLLEQTFTRTRFWQFFRVAVIPTYIGTVSPDIDTGLLGLGGHHSLLFHSCVSYWILAVILKGRGQRARYVLIAYGIGLCSHLFIDAFDQAAIRWLPGGLFFDRMWLLGNSLLCLIFPPGRRANVVSATTQAEAESKPFSNS